MATPKENRSKQSVVVIMVPLPLQSHLNQLLQFSHVVSSYDIPVHYISSAPKNSQVKSRASNPLHDLTKIHFHDFSIPLLPSDPPEYQIPLSKQMMSLSQPITALLRSLSPSVKRLVVIHDVSVASVMKDVVSLPKVEAYAFSCCSALYSLVSMREVLGRNEIVLIEDLPSWESCFVGYVSREFIASHLQAMKSQTAGELYNSCRSIEGSFLEILANDNLSGKEKMWAVGPLHQTTIFKELRDPDKWLLEWLDKQEPNSVLYISFGTTTTLSDEEVKELALGLEQSEVKFIWLLRNADIVTMFSNEEEGVRPQIPDDFEERIIGMGMGKVVREWVPQVKILGHPSTGGFMSHCGWSSCMESISMGVPIAAWPINFDQPYNAVLITKLLKVGVVVREWDQRKELVSSSIISKAVRKLMASEEGDEIRKRVVEMSETIKQSVVQGGDCRLEWDSFIAHITR